MKKLGEIGRFVMNTVQVEFFEIDKGKKEKGPKHSVDLVSLQKRSENQGLSENGDYERYE